MPHVVTSQTQTKSNKVHPAHTSALSLGIPDAFDDSKLDEASRLLSAIRDRNGDGLAALEDFVSLRSLAKPESRASFQIVFRAEDDAFDCMAGSETLRSHDCASTLRDLHPSRSILQQGLGAFADPVAAFCRMKQACAEKHGESFSFRLTQGVGQASTLELLVDGRVALGDRLASKNDRAKLSSHGMTPLKLVPAKPVVNTPPASPLDDMKVRNFMPASIAMPELPKLDRQASAGLMSRATSFFFVLKDAIVGKWEDPYYTPLVGKLNALNQAIAGLPVTFEALQRSAADIGTSPDTIASAIDASKDLLASAQEAIAALLEECASVGERVDGREAVRKLTGEAQHIAEQLATLEDRLDGLQAAETGERGQWRKTIDDLRDKIESNSVVPEASRFSTRDLLWLAQFQQTISAMERPLDRGTMIDALSQLMQGGAVMPETAKTTLALLAEFYDGVTKASSDQAPMQSAEALAKEQPTMLNTPGRKGEYEDLVSSGNTLLQRRDHELRFLGMLREASDRAAEKLPKRIAGIEGKSEYAAVARTLHSRVDDLQNYYALAWRDNTEEISSGEKVRINALKTRLSPDDGRLLEKMVNTAAQEILVSKRRSVDPEALDDHSADDLTTTEQEAVDGTLSLFAQAHIDVSMRDELMLATDEPLEVEDLPLMPGAVDAYQALDAVTRGEIERLAKECLQLDHQLYYYTQGEGQTDQAVDLRGDAVTDSIGGLFTRFERNPEAHVKFLAQRAEGVQALEAALQKIIGKLPATGADSLRTPLQGKLDECRLERTMLGRVLDDSAQLAPLYQLRQAESAQLALQKELKSVSVELEAPFVAKLLETNVKAYQLRSDVLSDNIKATRETVLAQNQQKNALKALELKLKARAASENSSLLAAGADMSAVIAALNKDDLDVVEYGQRSKAVAEASANLDQLKAEFRLGLLSLQREEERANAPGGGGYPEQQYWSSWVAHLMGDKAKEAVGIKRESPRSLLLEQQLSLSGKTIGEAYQDLWSVINDPKTSATQQLGLTSERIGQWNAAYPEEIIMFSSNIKHAASALLNSYPDASQQLTSMVRTTWDQATTESMMRDAMFGQRSSIIGAVETEPMPPALLALLSIAEWAPYAAGAVSGLRGGNVGATAATAAATLIGGGAVAGPAVAIVSALGGMAQIHAEKNIAKELAKYREANVMVNAVLKGLALDSSEGVASRVKEMAKYVAQRSALREVGNLRTDLTEVGKTGAVKRYMQEISLIWKNSSPAKKVMLVAATVVASAGVGLAVGAALFPLLGVPIAIAIATAAALLSTTGTRALWSQLSGSAVMGTVQGDINRQRMDVVIEEAKMKLADAMSKNQERIQNSAPLKKYAVNVEVNDVVEELTPRLREIADEVIKANPGARGDEVVALFVAAVQTQAISMEKDRSGMPKATLDESTLNAIVKQGGNQKEAQELVDQANKMLMDEIERGANP